MELQRRPIGLHSKALSERRYQFDIEKCTKTDDGCQCGAR